MTELNAKIRAFIDGWNCRAHPFIWTRTADDILKKANLQTTSNARHQEDELLGEVPRQPHEPDASLFMELRG